MAEHGFINMIKHLRGEEAVLLFGKYATSTDDERRALGQFLGEEYQRECIEYPFEVPEFNEAAAVWAAELVYISAQLLLNREKTIDEIGEFPDVYNAEISASAHLSADLCLRFLPEIIKKLEQIDKDDELIPKLKKYLEPWSYSAIGCLRDDDVVGKTIFSTPCVRALYMQRLLERKQIHAITDSEIQESIRASVGLHGKELLDKTAYEKLQEWKAEKE